MDSLLPTSSDAGRRPPAPGRLEVLRTFLNTVDIESGDEDFSSPRTLADWLIERGLLARGTSLIGPELSSAITFRETVREVLEANEGQGTQAGPVARLDEIASRVLLRIRIGAAPRLEPEGATGVDAAIGRLLAIIYDSVTEGTWERLKVCRNDACRWAFYDSSRNHSGAWCSMAICGNRNKGRVFRQHRSAG